MKTVREIPQELINKYVAARSKAKKGEKDKAVLRKKLLPLFEQGYVCPEDSPFILEVLHESVTRVDWEKAYRAVAKQLYGSLWGREYRRVQKNTIPAKQQKIIVKTNPNLAEE